MKWAMNENSLFAILLRSAWWVSFAVAAALIAIALALLPETYRLFGVVTGLPFIVIGCMSAWRQLQAPSSARIDRTLAAVRAMTWGDFAGAVEDGYRRAGFAVSRVDGGAADFEITKEFRTFVVSGKRFKVARTGIEPLRELHAVRLARDAHESIYIAIGDVSDNAREFATAHRIALVGGLELAQLLPDMGRTRKRA